MTETIEMRILGVTILMDTIRNLQGPSPDGEDAAVRGACDKRRREYLAGRTLARRALERAGAPGPHVLPAGTDRMPCWPQGILGSISHTAEYCGCAVVPAGQVKAVGIDLEACGRIRPHLWPRLFSPAEIGRLKQQPADRLAEAVTRVFCAKEAYYKMQFPLFRQQLAFTDVTVDPRTAEQMRVTPAQPAGSALPLPVCDAVFSRPFPGVVFCCCILLDGPSENGQRLPPLLCEDLGV